MNLSGIPGVLFNDLDRKRRSAYTSAEDGDFAESKNALPGTGSEYTTVGIHKDDLVFEMNGYPVKSLGSQGQQKSYLVALKLAKFDYIKSKAGFAPVLLLDDIFDKFDADRVAQIIRLVGNHRFGQIFITDTHQSRLQEIELAYRLQVFRIGEQVLMR
jgi:DNA replication and repair protein RecF